MKGSFKLGRFAGIDVYLHFTFPLFLLLIATLDLTGGSSMAAAMHGVVFVCAVFGCVLLHEFGHALAARHYGIRTRDITLLPIGGVARLERIPENPIQELWVALAGPAVNVVLIVLLGAWMILTGRGIGMESLEWARGPLAPRLLLANVAMVLFNLVPAFPMDGGRVLRAILAFGMNHARATRIAAGLGQVIAVGFAVFGLLAMLTGQGNPLLLFIAIFIWFAARQEAAMATLRQGLGRPTVRDAMLTRYAALSPHESLGRAEDLMRAGYREPLPVVVGRQVVGLLTFRNLVSRLAACGRGCPVELAMSRVFPVVEADQPLESVLASNLGRTVGLVPVVERGEIVGLLHWDLLAAVLSRGLTPAPGVAVPPRIPPLLSS